jgi:hypothetical protein
MSSPLNEQQGFLHSNNDPILFEEMGLNRNLMSGMIDVKRLKNGR